MREESTVEKRDKQDLTVGSPFRVLLLFALPLLVSIIFQQLYNVVDSVVAGRLISENALASIGVATPVTQLFLAIATGASIGVSVIVAQLFGLKEKSRLKSAIYTSLIACAVLAAVLTVIGLLVCDPLLNLLGTPKEDSIFSDASAYLAIYVRSLIFIFIYNIVNAVFTGLGDSLTPLLLLIASSVVNVALDVVFALTTDFGVMGLAWATFTAQAAAAIAALIILLVRVKKKLGKEKSPPFSWSLLKKTAIVALPSICQQSFVSVGQLCVQSVINGLGASIISGYTAALKVSIMAICCFTTLSSAISSFTGQNLGASKPERVKSGLKCGFIIGTVLTGIFIALFATIGGKIVGLFVRGDSSSEIIEAGRLFLLVVCFGYPFCMIKVSHDGVLRGSGDMIEFMVSTFSDLVIRVALSFILTPFMGFLGVCLSYPIGWAMSMILSLIFYARGKWKKKIKV